MDKKVVSGILVVLVVVLGLVALGVPLPVLEILKLIASSSHEATVVTVVLAGIAALTFLGSR